VIVNPECLVTHNSPTAPEPLSELERHLRFTINENSFNIFSFEGPPSARCNEVSCLATASMGPRARAQTIERLGAH
jgi:hypothetical protein